RRGRGRAGARRRLDLDRVLRAGRHVERDHRQAAAFHRHDLCRSGRCQAAARCRHHRGVQHAGRAQGVRPQRNRPLGQGHPRQRQLYFRVSFPLPLVEGQEWGREVMFKRRCMGLTSLTAALLLVGATSAAFAQDARDTKNYPNHTIRMIVPFPPGGPADTIARLLGAKMSEHWGQAVVIENRAGGNTAIGAEVVAKSAPDGYTLLVAIDVTMVMNPLVMTNLPYDPQKDLASVTLLTKNISLITTRSDGPKTIAELIAKAKANPGKLNVGAGTITSRLGALAFLQAAGIDVTLVPYKGSADITQGLLTGAVDFAQDSVSNALPLIEPAKFRALAKYSNRPLPLLPDVPSLSVA